MENKKFENVELAKKDIFESVIYFLHGIFDCIEGIDSNCLDWNYDFKRIGNYEMISRLTINEDNIPNINFQINNRANNHQKLFEWNFLFDYSKKANNFFEKLTNKMYELDYELDKLDFEDEEIYYKEKKKLEKKQEKIIKEFPKKIFKNNYVDFEKAVNTILENEYNKLYNFNDIKLEIFLDERKELNENEVRIDDLPDDVYYLFFQKNSKNNEIIDIIGFYSIPFNELKIKKGLECIEFYKDDFCEVQEFIKKGKTLKDWLAKHLDTLY